MRSVSIFGATGSIGESAFDLLMGSGGPQAWRTVAPLLAKDHDVIAVDLPDHGESPDLPPGYRGDIALWHSGPGAPADGVGLRDLYPTQPDADSVPDCATAGVLGVTTSVVGGLMSTEVIKFLGPWKSVGQVEWETLKWVDWYNKTRLHSAIGYVTPNEAEEEFYTSLNAAAKAA